MNLNKGALRRLRIATIWGPLALAACSVTPPGPPDVPFELPAQFAASPARAYVPGDRWWHGFDDDRLNQFVATALERNPGLAQAIARTRIAEARTRLSRADQLPQVGLSAGSTRQRQNMTGLPGAQAIEGGQVLSTNHSVAMDVSWELDLWGRLSAMSASAQADYLANGEQLRGMRQSVAAQAVRLYFEVVHARAQVELSERIVKSFGGMAEQINNRVTVGIASPADGMLANANAESARAGLEQRLEALERSVRQLEVLIGDYPTGASKTAHVLPKVPLPPAAGIPADLLARRPDVQAAEMTLRAAGYQIQAAQRSFLPSISLTGSAGYAGSELADLFSSSSFIWSIAGRILQPIFQGGRLTAQVDIAEGQRDEALHSYAETALNALAEVEIALAVDTLLARREDALDSSATAAEEAVKVSFNRYFQGIDPFLNVLESQQRALDNRSAYINTHFARLENRIALHLALGGGFTDEPQR